MNSLAQNYPHLAIEWSADNEKDFTEFKSQSNKRAIWVCSLGHTYSARIQDKTRRSDGCPYCSGHRVLYGFNDLFTTNPELESEWSPNNIVDPKTISRGSETKAIWVCSNGHEWSARVANRAVHTRGCKQCVKPLNPFIVSAIRELLSESRTAKPNALLDGLKWSNGARFEVDILIGNTVIEYDGNQYHKTTGRIATDIEKTIRLLDAGYKVIRIREGLPDLSISNSELVQIPFRYTKDIEKIRSLVDRILPLIV